MRFLSSLFLALLLTVGPTASAAEARRLMALLGVGPEALVAEAYVDLLANP